MLNFTDCYQHNKSNLDKMIRFQAEYELSKTPKIDGDKFLLDVLKKLKALDRQALDIVTQSNKTKKKLHYTDALRELTGSRELQIEMPQVTVYTWHVGSPNGDSVFTKRLVSIWGDDGLGNHFGKSHVTPCKQKGTFSPWYLFCFEPIQALKSIETHIEYYGKLAEQFQR